MKPVLVLVLTFCFVLVACDENSVNASAPSQADLQAKEISDLKARISALEHKPVHHYEFKSTGSRMWRLDTTTGESCIALADQKSWGDPDIKSQACKEISSDDPPN